MDGARSAGCKIKLSTYEELTAVVGYVSRQNNLMTRCNGKSLFLFADYNLL